MTADHVRTLAPATVLDTWEAGEARHPIDRAVLLVHESVEPVDGSSEITSWPLGARDAHLLRLRRAMYGDALPGRSECPGCGEAVEVELSCAELLAASAPSGTPPAFEFVHDGVQVRFRLPDSRDLAAIAGYRDIAEAHAALVDRCVVSAVTEQGESVPTLPEAVAAELAARISANDPGAEFLLDLTCAVCEHQWQTFFEIGTWLWEELGLEARSTLLEVDALARAYGWTEAEVLALSPARRALYLDLVQR
jgi:hypothetical protein